MARAKQSRIRGVEWPGYGVGRRGSGVGGGEREIGFEEAILSFVYGVIELGVGAERD